MAYAVVESGGKQYIARSGETIDVDRLRMKEGEKVTFENVLLIGGDGAAEVGSPHVKGAKVEGHVLEEFKGPKVVVFKYKPKIRYRKRQGHRQWYTRVAIDDVVAAGSGKAATKATKSDDGGKTTKSEPKPKASKKPEAKAASTKAADKPAKAKAPAKKEPAPKKPAPKKTAAKKPAAKPKKTSGSSKKASGTKKDKKAE
jgi:large subunit ribosomal protein L21